MSEQNSSPGRWWRKRDWCRRSPEIGRIRLRDRCHVILGQGRGSWQKPRRPRLHGVQSAGSATLQEFVDLAMQKFGRIDGVVNCTGHGPKGPVDEISDEDWHTGLDYYMLNVVRMTRLVLPIMRAQKSGSIVNISTFAAFEPGPGLPDICGLQSITCGLHQAVCQ